MKKNNYLILAILFMGLIHCGGGSSSSSSSEDQNEDFISFDFNATTEFDPYVNHGQLETIKVVVSGDEIKDPIIKHFPYGTNQTTLPPLPAGKNVIVEVFGLNTNGVIIRKGISDIIEVKEGGMEKITLSYQDVPIFTNVYEGATVYKSRFVPKVFARSNLSLQITDLFEQSIVPLFDEVIEDSILSLNQTSENSFRATIPIRPLDPGSHQLSISDPESGVKTELTLNIIEDNNKKYLLTTGGEFLGAINSDLILSVSNHLEENHHD